MATVHLTIANASVKFGAVVDPIDPATLTEYNCQVTQAQITATSNTTTTTVPATFCQAASESTRPVASSFSLNLDFLQDWTLTAAASLSAFLFKHDAEKQAFALYLDGAEDPSATGIVTVVAGSFAGTPGEPLTGGPLTMQIDGYPDIVDSAGVSIRSGVVMASGTAAAPESEPVGESVAA